MNKKTLLTLIGCTACAFAMAQTDRESRLANIDWEEDSAEIVTISDILADQQKVASVRNREQHIGDVWSNRKFTNISFSTMKMKSDGQINTGGAARNLEYDTNWGVAITRGKNLLLHRKPIGNVLSFYIDYVGFDLGVNHYEYKEDSPLYDPLLTFTDSENNEYCRFTPWDFEKYEVNYGMRLGPSVTIAPFANLRQGGLNFLKLNFYVHFGYNVSFNYIGKDKVDEDKNGSLDHYVSGTGESEAKASSNLGHGMYTTFGFNLSWKKFGVGLESRSSKYEYKPLDSDFGEDKYKFKTNGTRFFIQFRW